MANPTVVFTVYQTGLSTLQFSDITGLRTSANLTGWNNSVNKSYSQVTAAVLTGYIPNTTTFAYSSAFVTINLFAKTYPITLRTIDLDSTDLGLSAGTSIPSGEYKWVLDLTFDDATTATSEFIWIYFAKTRCCLDKISAANGNCGCSDSKKQAQQLNLLSAQAALDSMDYALTCNNFTSALNSLIFANDVCQSSNCSGCKEC